MISERVITGLYLSTPSRITYLESAGVTGDMFEDTDLGLAFEEARGLFTQARMSGLNDLLDHVGPRLTKGVSNLKDCLVDSMSREGSQEMAYHAAMVVDSWRKKQLVNLVGEFYHKAASDKEPLASVQRFERMVAQSSTYTTAPAYFKGPAKVNPITSILQGTYRVPVTPTGFPGLDQIIGGGLHNGRVNINAAGTGQGKSNLAIAILDNIQESTGGYVLYMTPELDREEVEIRRAARRCGINSDALRSGKLTPQERERLMGLDLGHRILVDDYAIPTVDYVRKRTLELHALYGLKAVAFDYAERIWGQGKIQERLMELMIVAEQLAKILGAPFLLNSQFNRDVMDLKKPTVANLANGSALEKMASLILANRWHAKNTELGGCKPPPADDGLGYTTWQLKNTYARGGGQLDWYIDPGHHDFSLSSNDLPF